MRTLPGMMPRWRNWALIRAGVCALDSPDILRPVLSVPCQAYRLTFAALTAMTQSLMTCRVFAGGRRGKSGLRCKA
ncbi:hypothetical protein D3C76_1575280 [compost metagenome]